MAEQYLMGAGDVAATMESWSNQGWRITIEDDGYLMTNATMTERVKFVLAPPAEKVHSIHYYNGPLAKVGTMQIMYVETLVQGSKFDTMTSLKFLIHCNPITPTRMYPKDAYITFGFRINFDEDVAVNGPIFKRVAAEMW